MSARRAETEMRHFNKSVNSRVKDDFHEAMKTLRHYQDTQYYDSRYMH